MTMDVFLLHRFVFFPLSLTRVLLDLITWVTQWMLIRSRNCLPCASTSCIHPGFLMGSVLLMFFFVFILCLVCQMLSESLECVSLIALSGFFSYVYLQEEHIKCLNLTFEFQIKCLVFNLLILLILHELFWNSSWAHILIISSWAHILIISSWAHINNF